MRDGIFWGGMVLLAKLFVQGCVALAIALGQCAVFLAHLGWWVLSGLAKGIELFLTRQKPLPHGTELPPLLPGEGVITAASERGTEVPLTTDGRSNHVAAAYAYARSLD